MDNFLSYNLFRLNNLDVESYNEANDDNLEHTDKKSDDKIVTAILFLHLLCASKTFVMEIIQVVLDQYTLQIFYTADKFRQHYA